VGGDGGRGDAETRRQGEKRGESLEWECCPT
jgi:hypothetical protein